MSGGNWQQLQNYWLPLTIVGGLVLLTSWQGRLSDQHPVQAGPSLGHNPDYFVDGLVATAYDIAGVPRYHLSANKMVHYLDDNTTTLESPTFVRDGPGVARVAARSSHGEVSADGEIVYLLGSVHLTEDGQGGQMPIDLTTQYLKILPNEDRLSTDKPVTLRQGDSVLTANSMMANGKEQTMQLSGRVKGIYETHR